MCGIPTAGMRRNRSSVSFSSHPQAVPCLPPAVPAHLPAAPAHLPAAPAHLPAAPVRLQAVPAACRTAPAVQAVRSLCRTALKAVPAAPALSRRAPVHHPPSPRKNLCRRIRPTVRPSPRKLPHLLLSSRNSRSRENKPDQNQQSFLTYRKLSLFGTAVPGRLFSVFRPV